MAFVKRHWTDATIAWSSPSRKTFSILTFGRQSVICLRRVKHQLKGKSVIIESPWEFQSWLAGGHHEERGWLQRAWRSLRGA